jgi:hypothetical protein
MDYGTVRIILEKATSSPAEVDLPKLDEAIRLVEDSGTIRRLDRGANRTLHSPHFEAAAVEMRVLRQLLAHGWFAGTAESAQSVLRLLGLEISLPGIEGSREVSLRGMESRTGTNQWEHGRKILRRTTSRREPMLKLFFSYAISIVGLLLFAAFSAR